MKGFLLLLISFSAMLLFADISISDVEIFSGWPWKDVLIGYKIKGTTEKRVALKISAKDMASGRTFLCKTLEGAGLAEGSYVVRWRAQTDGIVFKSDNVVFTIDIKEVPPPPLYCVIDLSGGTSATSYPITWLSSVPSGGWSDEYKTTKLVLRRIESGSFIMGDNQVNENHRVILSKMFYMGIFEVTQRQWELVAGYVPTCINKGDLLPVEAVSSNRVFYDFVNNLQLKTGLDFNLPTEAQWEYACRAGTTTSYYWGDAFDGSYAWYGENAGSVTHPVGAKLPNYWGLYDMIGNVSEWCLDLYGGLSYGLDPSGVTSGDCHVVRGGSWRMYSTSSTRWFENPWSDYDSYDGGFRLARTVRDDESAVVDAEMKVLFDAQSDAVAINTTFVDGTKVGASDFIAYGIVGVGPCSVVANGVEIVNASVAGRLDWTLAMPGENELVYFCSGMTMSSVISATDYEISYDTKGGSPMPCTDTKWNGFVYGSLPTVMRKGYAFAGWFTEANGGTLVTSNSIVDAARTLYAHWEEYWCAIRFDPQNGVGGASESVLRGDFAYGVLPVVTRSGFKFLGWFTAANGGTQITEGSIVDSDRTLYAHWQKIMHAISFDTNNGASVTKGSYQEAFPYGELPQVTRDGFNLLGWFTEPDGGERVTADTIVDSSRTLYAHWERYAYDFRWLGGGKLDVCSGMRRTDGAQGIAMDPAWGNGGARAVVSVDGVEKAESRGADEFVWSGDETKEYTLKHQVYDVQGRAVGEPYTAKIAWTSRAAVTFDGGNGEDAFSREYDKSYAYGELPSVTKTGHTFAGWYTAAEGGEKVEAGAQFDGSVSKLYAHWTVNRYGVKFDKNGGEGTAGDLTVAYGDVVPMEGVAFRKSGYRLAGWATAADGAAVYGQSGAMSNLTAEANGCVQLYAVWELTTVGLKSFKQRYPWNGFVDVVCEVGAEGRVGLMLIDEESGTNFTAKTLFCQGGSVTNSALWMSEGWQKFIWDAGSDLPDGFKTSKLKAKTYFVEGEE